jgi:hypothetical protein
MSIPIIKLDFIGATALLLAAVVSKARATIIGLNGRVKRLIADTKEGIKYPG